MKKIIIYAYRPDEFSSTEKFKEKYGFELTRVEELFSPDNAHLSAGHDGVIFMGTCAANAEALKIVADNGIKIISTKSAGYNNIDIKAANECGFTISHVPSYSPNAISEYAVTAALCLARNVPQMIRRGDIHDYSVPGLIGFEIRKSTVGIIGTGRIGRESAKAFKGFGARVIGSDPYPVEEAKAYLEYVPLEQLLKEADVISMHAPMLDENYHMINKDTLKLMKPKAILVNTSRGGLVNAGDVLDALLNEKLGGFAMDVYEHEVGILFSDCKNKIIKDPVFLALSALPNVLISPHYAFYTDEAVSNMIEICFSNLDSYFRTGKVITPVPGVTGSTAKN